MKLDMKTFYLFGAILFLVGAGGQLYNIAVSWNFWNIGVKVSGVSNFVFSLLLFAFFLKLYNDIKKAEKIIPIQSEVLDKLLEEENKK